MQPRTRREDFRASPAAGKLTSFPRILGQNQIAAAGRRISLGSRLGASHLGAASLGLGSAAAVFWNMGLLSTCAASRPFMWPS